MTLRMTTDTALHGHKPLPSRRRTVPRSWLIASIALNAAALASTLPTLFEGAVLTRERFTIRDSEGEVAGWFQATETGSELVVGDEARAVRVSVDGDGAHLGMGPLAAPTTRLAVTPGGASLTMLGHEQQVALEVTGQRSSVSVSSANGSISIDAGDDWSRLKLVSLHRGPTESDPDGQRTVEVVAGAGSASIVATGGQGTLRYSADDEATRIEMKALEGRVLVESSPYPRIVLESAQDRFELGRNPRVPNTLARWEYIGRTYEWPTAPYPAPREGER